MVNLATKTGRLQNLLAQKIFGGEFKKGEKLPSVRELAIEFNVSPLTAKLALSELKNKGLIDTRQGAGSFVVYEPERKKEKHYNIGLAYLMYYTRYPDQPSTTHPALLQWLSGAEDHFSAELACIIPLSYRKYKLCEPTSAVRLAVENGRVDGLIITGWITSEEVDFLLESKIPFVLIDHYVANRSVAQVVRSDTLGFRTLISHLVELGHKRIMCGIYTTNAEYIRNGIGSFIQIARSIGCEGFGEDNIILIPNDDPDNPPDYVNFAQKILDCKPSAVILPDEIPGTRLLAECLRRGLRVPEDISIAVGADAWVEGHIMKFTRLNSIALQREAVRIGSELLERALRGEDISQTYIVLSPALIVGESTGRYSG